MSSTKNRVRNQTLQSELSSVLVDDVLIATDWRPGRGRLVIEVRCPCCNKLKARMRSVVPEPPRVVSPERRPIIWLKYGSTELATVCSCGRYNTGVVTVRRGYPVTGVLNVLDGRWTCSSNHKSNYLGSVQRFKGRVYLRCCGRDLGFSVSRAIAAATNCSVEELPDGYGDDEDES